MESIFLEFFRDDQGRYPFEDWMRTLSIPDRVRISKRLSRVRMGSFGDIAPVGEGLSELREHFGPGYRIYIAVRKDHALVLTGSDKSNQKRTIELAKHLWNIWKSRIS